MARNPLQGQVAVVGVGSTTYGRDLQRSHLSLGLEAAIRAIEDAGIAKNEIDGICGSGSDVFAIGNSSYLAVQGALGIERTTWVMNGWLGSCFVYAAQAVWSGLCDVCLIVQSYVRTPGMSRSADNDPIRRLVPREGGGSRWTTDDLAERWYHSGEPYAAWMGRYLHEYGATKETFGCIAVNNRTQASKNPNAIARTPITMDDYMASRTIWAPMQMLDMDVPVDCGEALILTTAERAADMAQQPVYIDAMSLGGTRVGEHYEQGIGWTETSPWVALQGLWERTSLRIDDVDLFIPYDGYTVNAVAAVEAAGFCAPGEAGDLFTSSWVADEGLLKLNGRTYVSSNGGSLSQGRAGGFNYYAEAVRQLRGTCGDRQIVDARHALVAGGSFYHDPPAVMLTSTQA